MLNSNVTPDVTDRQFFHETLVKFGQELLDNEEMLYALVKQKSLGLDIIFPIRPNCALTMELKVEKLV